MSCQHEQFSRILALTEKSFCLTGNPIKTLLAIVVKKGVKLQILVKKTSILFNYYKRMLKI